MTIRTLITEVLRGVKLLWLLCLSYMVCRIGAINLLLSRVRCRLLQSAVDKKLQDFRGMFGPMESRPVDFRQAVVELLESVPDETLTKVRLMYENTRPGRQAVKGAADRRLYAVLRPTRGEELKRILAAFDAYPEAARENCYIVTNRMITDPSRSLFQ